MSQDNSKGTPPEPEQPKSLEDFKRLIAEAETRGEDPMPLVRRAVLSTIDLLARRAKRKPDDD